MSTHRTVRLGKILSVEITRYTLSILHGHTTGRSLNFHCTRRNLLINLLIFETYQLTPSLHTNTHWQMSPRVPLISVDTIYQSVVQLPRKTPLPNSLIFITRYNLTNSTWVLRKQTQVCQQLLNFPPRVSLSKETSPLHQPEKQNSCRTLAERERHSDRKFSGTRANSIEASCATTPRASEYTR